MPVFCLSLVTILYFWWTTVGHSIITSKDCIKERLVLYTTTSKFFKTLIHHRNLQILTFEIKNNLAPEILTEPPPPPPPPTFPPIQVLSSYNLRNCTTLYYFGTKNVFSFFQKFFQKIVSLTLFKKKIREWIPSNCPCRLCKTYAQNIEVIYTQEHNDQI